MKQTKKAFVASDELLERIENLQHELNLESAGEVIALGISMLELSLGRNVEFSEKNKSFRVSKFAGHNQTVILDEANND